MQLAQLEAMPITADPPEGLVYFSHGNSEGFLKVVIAKPVGSRMVFIAALEPNSIVFQHFDAGYLHVLILPMAPEVTARTLLKDLRVLGLTGFVAHLSQSQDLRQRASLYGLYSVLTVILDSAELFVGAVGRRALPVTFLQTGHGADAVAKL